MAVAGDAIQHPLAERWIELEAAEPLVLRAATAFDRGEDAGVYANAAKYCAAQAGVRACETAVMTHGGLGYAREYCVERYFREIQIVRIAPVSPQLSLSFIAERVLAAEIVLKARAAVSRKALAALTADLRKAGRLRGGPQHDYVRSY